MAYPWGPTTFDALGTGSSVTQTEMGSSTVVGSGTSLVVVPGLFSSAKCMEIVTTGADRRYFRAPVSGTVHWTGGDFQADAPQPSGVLVLVKYEDALGDTQAELRFTQKGILKMCRDGGVVVGDSEAALLGNPDGDAGPEPGEQYHWLHKVDTVTGTQTVYVWRTGQFIKMGGADRVIGPEPITHVQIGVCETGPSVTIRLDNVFATNVDQTVPEELDVLSVWPGNARTGSVDLIVNSLGYSSHRARIFRPGDSDSILITDSYSVATARGRATVKVNSLSPDTDYEYELEGFHNTAWEDTGWTRGTFRTLPQPFRPWSGSIFGYGCRLNKSPGTQPETTEDVILAKIAAGEYRYWWHKGDFTYDNLTDLEAGVYRDSFTNRFLKKPLFNQMVASSTMLAFSTSDHEVGGQDAVTQHESTEFYNVAWLDMTPHWETWRDSSQAKTETGGDPVEFTKSTSGDVGRVHFLFPDFRWLGRSASDDPDTDAKVAYHPSDEAEIIAAFDNEAYPVVVLCTDQPWVGSAASVTPKDDHTALYPNQRARINAAIARRIARGQGAFIWFGDYHGLCQRDAGTSIDDTAGGAAVCGGTGAGNNSGNIRPLDVPNYTAVFAEEQDPDPEIDIWVSDELVITDDGEQITLRWNGWDNDAEAIVLTSGDLTWDAPYTAPQAMPPSFDIGPLRCTDPFGRWKMLAGSEYPPVPAKTGASSQSMQSHGRSISNVFAEGGRFTVQVEVNDLDVDGVSGGRLQRQANEKIVKGVCGSPFRRVIGYRPQWTEEVTEQADGFILSSVPTTVRGPTSSIVTISIDLEREFTSNLLEVFSQDMTDGDVDGVRVTTLDGSTAPITRALFRMSGAFTRFTVTDATAEDDDPRWLKVTVPDDEYDPDPDLNMVPLDKAVVVDGWSVWLIDEADGWDTSAGDDISGWLDSTSTGDVPLILYPIEVDDDADDRGVIVNLNIGPRAGNPLLQIRSREGHY